MNPLQLAQQAREELRTVTWDSGELVFGPDRAFVAVTAPTADQMPPTFPWCFVVIGAGTADEDDPDFIPAQQLTLIAAAQVFGDPRGEFSVTGGVRPSAQESGGAGLGEVTERVRFALQKLLGSDGAKIKLSADNFATSEALGRGLHVATNVVTLTGACTSQPHYAAPQQMQVSGDTWTWEGPHCSDRFDFYQYRMFRVPGSTPTEQPTGTEVYAGTAPTTGPFFPSPGNVYQVFADYNSRGDAAVEASSSGLELGSYLVF